MPSFDFAGGTATVGSPIGGSRIGGSPSAGAAVLERVRRDINLVQLHDELWRVTRADGDVLGYVESFVEPRGRRFRAKRLIALQKRFLPIGEFWSFDDAVDCLRFG